MSDRERDDDLETPLGIACAALFAPGIESGEIDILEFPDENAVEIQADEWTFHLQGDPIALAFIAIENEPEQAGELTQALLDSLTPGDRASLAALDTQLDGALIARLMASGDGLSQALAAILAGEMSTAG